MLQKAGVQIEMIVRGFVVSFRESKVKQIISRLQVSLEDFLEHSRIYILGVVRE